MVSSGLQQKKGLPALLQFVAVSVVTGVVAAGLAIPAVGAASAGTEGAVEIFDALPAELEERPLAQQSTMYDANGDVMARFFWQNREEVNIENISQYMQDATVAIEDERFFDHGGVDIEGIARAAVHNLISTSTQGGSTLTQQYVKNVLVENVHSEDEDNRAGIDEARESEGTAGYARKLREAKLAVAVEKKYEKIEILNRYLNINNYSGSPNNYGVEAAAHHYWGVSAKDLSLAQSAMLAGIVQNPARFNPENNPEDTLQRRNTVLNQMLKYEFITQEEHDEATATELDLDIHNTPNGCSAAEGKEYFCDFVEAVIGNSDLYGDDADARKRFLQRGGLEVHTTLNPDLQDAANEEVSKTIKKDDKSGAGHTIVTVEPGTGKVLAMTQNRNYTVQEVEDDISSTSMNYNVDLKHHGGGGFQVGSTWKPFVLAQWLTAGKTLNTGVNATKRNFPAGSWTYNGCDNNGGPYNPNNAGDGKGSSSMTALQATKGSVNTAYTAMANQLNMCKIMDTAMDLGLKYGDGTPLDAPVAEGQNKGLTYALLPSSVLGTVQVAPIDMAAAYGAFAAKGKYCKPIAIESITDQEGKEIEVPDAECHQALDEDVAAGVAYALTQTFNGGTTSGLQPGAPAGAKTGTTNFPVGMTWLVGFTSSMSTAVWTGDPKGNRDWRKNRSGAVRGSVFGATFSGKTWSRYMRKAVKVVDDNKSFGRPPGSIMGSAPKPPSSNNDDRRGGDDNRGGGGGGGGGRGGGDNGGGGGGGLGGG